MSLKDELLKDIDELFLDEEMIKKILRKIPKNKQFLYECYSLINNKILIDKDAEKLEIKYKLELGNVQSRSYDDIFGKTLVIFFNNDYNWLEPSHVYLCKVTKILEITSNEPYRSFYNFEVECLDEDLGTESNTYWKVIKKNKPMKIAYSGIYTNHVCWYIFLYDEYKCIEVYMKDLPLKKLNN